MADNVDRQTSPIAPATDLDDGRIIFSEKSHGSTASPPPQSQAVEQPRGDTSITKINSRYSPRGKYGQKYLAAGVKTSMRLWEDEEPKKPKAVTRRAYETVGFVIKGRAELEIEGQRVTLEPGDSWIVPKGARHRYHIVESFTAVEVTCPPAEIHGRDEEESA
jgi:mannose-6-phosphate isomerase-like protein (cupin superfamily)